MDLAADVAASAISGCCQQRVKANVGGLHVANMLPG
jgi:hypothetical protein